MLYLRFIIQPSSEPAHMSNNGNNWNIIGGFDVENLFRIHENTAKMCSFRRIYFIFLSIKIKNCYCKTRRNPL